MSAYCEPDPGLRIQQADEILLLRSSLSIDGRQTLHKHTGYQMSAVEKNITVVILAIE